MTAKGVRVQVVKSQSCLLGALDFILNSVKDRFEGRE